ncbi:MAG: hypothetical protein ACJ798_15800 [Phenylobacterium sp.]
MPRIIISCPTTGEDVPTGHRTQDFELCDVVEPRSFRCPVCQEVHRWLGCDAKVEDLPRSPSAAVH